MKGLIVLECGSVVVFCLCEFLESVFSKMIKGQVRMLRAILALKTSWTSDNTLAVYGGRNAKSHRDKDVFSTFVGVNDSSSSRVSLRFVVCFTLQFAKKLPFSRRFIQLFRERLSEKSTKVHATRPKGGLGTHYKFAYWPR